MRIARASCARGVSREAARRFVMGWAIGERRLSAGASIMQRNCRLRVAIVSGDRRDASDTDRSCGGCRRPGIGPDARVVEF